MTLSLAAACSSFACTRDNPAFDAHESETFAGDGDPSSNKTTAGDGDGDGDDDPTTGDDDPTTGDGDGDGDPTTDDPICGNGVLEEGEACDDGNTIDDDDCNNECALNTGVCGDGTLDPGEQCDDGNANNDDLCAADCTWTFAMCAVSDPITNCEDCLDTYCCTNVVAACIEAPTCLCAIVCVHDGGDLGACSMQCNVSSEVAILISGSIDCFLDECAELCL